MGKELLPDDWWIYETAFHYNSILFNEYINFTYNLRIFEHNGKNYYMLSKIFGEKYKTIPEILKKLNELLPPEDVIIYEKKLFKYI